MSQSLFPFSLHSEFADGRNLEFVPTAVRPLGLSELMALSRQPDTSIALQCLADDPKIDGEVVMGTASLNAHVTFDAPVAIFALVPNGGWLPVPFVSPPKFLLDRNVVANLHLLRRSDPPSDRKPYHFWTKFFKQDTALFNPLPYALEGKDRRILSLEEFVQAFDQGVHEIAEMLPQSRVVRYSSAQYRLAYAQLQAMHANTPREIEFLCEICPLLAVPISDARLHCVANHILETAKRLGVNGQALAVLVSLSCLLQNPRSGTWSIGQKVLKPKQRYAPADAYNAISDLRHIELAAVGHAGVTQDQFALCTCDRAVAALWCALAMRDFTETATGPEFTIDYSPELFPRLTESGIREIASLLAA
jgi:hypothetical protein